MKIIREILGQKIEIELTMMEMTDAFNEVLMVYDCEKLTDFLLGEGYSKIPEQIIRGLVREIRNVLYGRDLDDGEFLTVAEKLLDCHRNLLSEYREEK